MVQLFQRIVHQFLIRFNLLLKLLLLLIITSRQIDGETVADIIFMGSKITAAGDCSHEIKRRLLLGRKVMTNWESILKSRDITVPAKVCLVKAMVFPVVMYGCESWTVKKAECRGIDAFELWYWRRLLRVPWTARRSNQSILKEISPWCSVEGLMLKLKLQYFGHLMRRNDSLERTVILGGIGGRRRRGRQRMRWLDGMTDSMDMGLGRLWEWGLRTEVHRVAKSQTRLSDWTELLKQFSLKKKSFCILYYTGGLSTKSEEVNSPCIRWVFPKEFLSSVWFLCKDGLGWDFQQFCLKEKWLYVCVVTPFFTIHLMA